MANWLNLGHMLKVNAGKYPDRVCLMDATRKYSFSQTNQRVNQLAHGLMKAGLKKGDKISVLLENCIEFVEIYLAAAKCGFVVNPINFRLVGPEIAYIAGHAESKAFIVHDEFCRTIDGIKDQLGSIGHEMYFCVGENKDGYRAYEQLLQGDGSEEPQVEVSPSDTWVLLYTSGTTGRPKGVLRSHESYVAFYLINAIDFDFRPGDMVLNVMPLCHVNTTYFSFNFTYIGGSIYVHPARGFRPLEILEIIHKAKINFISLVPTHYAILLSVPEDQRAEYDVSSVNKLLCSSAPARMEHKKEIMEWFKGVQLYEGYGSTEAGIVTTLMPDEQLTKLRSIGRESVGTDFIKILDENKKPVPDGEIGEIYSRGPMMFDAYYKDPEKTAEAFCGEWFSAGDMGYRDEDGYYFLVDRKNNMIITGGENVYPSEVENVLCCHPAVMDVAVIGIPDAKWGEAVKAVVVLKEGMQATQDDLKAHCKEHLAGFKCPKTYDFISDKDMPRTATGKIIHRLLRERYSSEREAQS